jgi:hypothetical protein
MTAMAMALSLLSRSIHNARSPFSLRTDDHMDELRNVEQSILGEINNRPIMSFVGPPRSFCCMVTVALGLASLVVAFVAK